MTNHAVEHSTSTLSSPVLAGASLSASQARSQIEAKTHRGTVSVPVDRVIYFKADQKYVTMGHDQGEVLLSEPLKSLETEFSDRFVRIHRNALVARTHMRKLVRYDKYEYMLTVDGVEEPLKVSRRLAPIIEEMLKVRK